MLLLSSLGKRRWSSKTEYFGALCVAVISCLQLGNSSSFIVSNSRTTPSAASRAWPRLGGKRGRCARKHQPRVQFVAVKQVSRSNPLEVRRSSAVHAFRWIETVSLVPMMRSHLDESWCRRDRIPTPPNWRLSKSPTVSFLVAHQMNLLIQMRSRSGDGEYTSATGVSRRSFGCRPALAVVPRSFLTLETSSDEELASTTI